MFNLILNSLLNKLKMFSEGRNVESFEIFFNAIKCNQPQPTCIMHTLSTFFFRLFSAIYFNIYLLFPFLNGSDNSGVILNDCLLRQILLRKLIS